MKYLRSPLSSTLLYFSLALTALPLAAQESQGLPAEVYEVETSTLNQVLNAVGTLRANESVILRPEITGRISDILFGEGEAVEAGQALIQLDGASYEAELAQAQAQANLSRLNISVQPICWNVALARKQIVIPAWHNCG
ncbi:biotin/lipoyl-binding protein [Nitrincola sp. A-D6]|uniref:biotin/lipoyl-binding protein n=1 Tax=Nitrincola sp. A-D6 TaxID=1545442 RepID=UPI00068BB954|nr:biotin/lipoyl-binding protein [Nitrincola sp. A-D6]